MSGTTTVGEVVTAALTRSVERLLRNDAILREGDANAVEAVHQMRVATRILRSDLRTFRSALEGGWRSELREELAWIARLLGAVRDADVLSERLSRTRELTPEQARAATEAVAALADRRAEAHAALLDALAGERYANLLVRLRTAAVSPALRSPGRADRAAGEALPAIVRRAWRALESKVASLIECPSDEELHGVRIAAKRCRYAAEACALTLGAPTGQLARACKRLQTVLGELNDAAVAERWLREWAAARSGADADAALELAALERSAARDARAHWRKAWEKAVHASFTP